MKKRTILFGFIFTLFSQVSAQDNFDYSITLKPITIDNFPGLHSYAFGQHGNKWVLIGGRKDGLHARQPFASFPKSENNTNIFVLDISAKKVWSAPISVLPKSLYEQLQSTNMNFHQIEDTLYIIGGYGYSDSKQDHITYPNLTTVIVSDLIDDVINGNSILGNFKQIEDSVFAVCGGQLSHLNNSLYLVGGQNFTGRYNPMGHNTYVQSYTNEIRTFHVMNKNNTLNYSNYKAMNDPVHLRRRDYNLLPQIYPDGSKGLMISSGVFQSTADLPFLYPVDIDSSGYSPRTSFNQYLSHYHSARASLFDSSTNTMHMLFFGGMSQYFYDDTALVKDDKVPFVNTISRLTRNSSGVMKEFQLSEQMPALIGASSEFIANEVLLDSDAEIILLKPNDPDSLLIGHIVGGIYSPSTNPFSSNSTGTTKAHETIYEVILTKNAVNSSKPIDGQNPYLTKILPNPAHNHIGVQLNTNGSHKVNYFISNVVGQVLQSGTFQKVSGKTTNTIDLDESISSQQLIVTLVIDSKFFITESILKY
ncbi:MAG: hypothetical protein KC517_03435 [Bacteroidetes bacterium]|jgi:hypothetical protein|nr:hypothetical protein [Bacteroidota bacterium]